MSTQVLCPLFKLIVCLLGHVLLFPHFGCLIFLCISQFGTSSSLGRVLLCNKLLVGLNGTVSMVTWEGCSRNLLCVGCVSLCCSWVLIAITYQQVKFIVGLTGCKDWLWPKCRSCCTGTDPMEKNLPQWALVSSGVPLVGLIGRCFFMFWIWPPGVLFLMPLGRGSCVGQGQPLHVTDMGLYGRSYKAISDYSWPVLELEPCRRSHTGNLEGCH